VYCVKSAKLIVENTSSPKFALIINELIEIGHGFTSAQYRLYGRQFLQVWWPNQQCQSTEGGWL